MKIVTAGSAFLDIDAYAGCIAYAELLNLKGDNAIAYSSAPLNESITKTIRSWDAPLSTSYSPGEDDLFVLIDVSEPEFFDGIVDLKRVSEVIDHHVGFEEYWQERIGEGANIEFIGAACTQVFESWEKSGHLSEMTELSARLLIAGILDNTLNFEANVTTGRDKRAYNELLKIANLPDNWTAQYFQECEDAIFADIKGALNNDTKILNFENLDIEKVAVGQMVLWDGKRALDEHRAVIQETIAARAEDWFLNLVSIKDGQSFFLASTPKMKEWAEATLSVKFNDNVAVADRLWLRKEIIRQTKLRN